MGRGCLPITQKLNARAVYENLFLSQARKEPYPMYFRYFFLINNM